MSSRRLLNDQPVLCPFEEQVRPSGASAAQRIKLPSSAMCGRLPVGKG